MLAITQRFRARVRERARVIVTRGNPSRGSGFEVAHFRVRDREIESLFDRDIFLPTLARAAAWVRQAYPSAKLKSCRRNRRGRLMALSFECRLSDIFGRRAVQIHSGKPAQFAVSKSKSPPLV